MRKVIAFVLAVVLVMGMAVSAFAATSPVAPVATEKKTAALPVVVGALPEDVTFVALHNADKLAAADRDAFMASQLALKEAAPEGMTAKYFFYVVCTNSFAFTMQLTNAEGITVMQFVDGKWTEVESALNADGTATVKGVVNGPIVIFTK